MPTKTHTNNATLTGNKVRRVNAVLGHPQVPWMLANIDREVVGAADVQILECKTAGINGAKLWRDGVPEYIQLQVMHQLAVTGKQAADVTVLICGHPCRASSPPRVAILGTSDIEFCFSPLHHGARRE